jgi:hypothetical protein
MGMYRELNDRLKKMLSLRGSAVAVALSNDRPALERLTDKERLCEIAEPDGLPAKNRCLPLKPFIRGGSTRRR